MASTITKPDARGIFTSEFFSVVGGTLAVLAVTFGLISADQQDHFAQLITGVLASLSGLGGIGAIYKMVSEYIKGRNELKLKLLDREVPVVAPVEPAPAV